MAHPESNERKWILLLCLLATIHTFIFSAAFPLIINVDEKAHFDLVMKYAHGHPPRSMEQDSKETMQYIVISGSQEFLWPPEAFPGKNIPPPPWTQPPEKIMPILLEREAAWQSVNHEAAQPPLYYTLAGFWWNIGKCLGIEYGRLLYWLRFLNILFMAALVWLGYAATKNIFPENIFVRCGVSALVAFMPQTAFYSINNDVLSPLCFGAAFLCLMKWLHAEIPDVRLGIFTGLALASVFLAKLSNLPLLAFTFATMLLKITQLVKSGYLRASLPSLASLLLCAGLPTIAWLAWCKINFGDFTGSAAKIHMLAWTLKSFDQWWFHPIFTPSGFWIFIQNLLATFWQGEFWWHRQPMNLPAVDIGYAILSIGLVGMTMINLVSRRSTATAPQRAALWISFGSFIASIAFFGFLSIIYDFHDCFYPSRQHPYFTSGRLMLGALIPFMLLFVYGMDRALKKFGARIKFIALTTLILFMLISEIVTDWPVFFSQYNWFHM